MKITALSWLKMFADQRAGDYSVVRTRRSYDRAANPVSWYYEAGLR